VTNPVEVGSTELPQPAISRFLFHDTRSAALWLVVRFYVGFAWLEGGLHKVVDEKWSYGNGAAILGYWKGAVAIPAQGAPRINEEYGWYRDFLNILISNEAHTWFAPSSPGARCWSASASLSAGWSASRPSSGR
jgi:hypothetical protein